MSNVQYSMSNGCPTSNIQCPTSMSVPLYLAESGNRPRKTVPLENVRNAPCWKLNNSAKNNHLSYLVMAMEVRGVVGAPFQIMVLPQDIARAEFQP